MLNVRIATALVLVAVVAGAAIYLPPPWLAAFFHVLALVAAYEWAKLAGLAKRMEWIGYAAALTAVVVALWLVPGAADVTGLAEGVAVAMWTAAPPAWLATFAVAALLWLVALVLVCVYPASARLLRSRFAMLAAGVVIIGATWLALVSLKMAGTGLLLWLLVAVALADTGAYFAGRKFGRRKLAPRVSPGKTWEGVVGGALATLAWGVGGAWLFDDDVLVWLGISAVVFFAAVLGDLLESAFKRARGVKDSGGLLPGHGGLLDRIDSLLAAAPTLALLLAVRDGVSV